MKNIVEIYRWWLEIIDKAGDPSWEDFEWSAQFNIATVLVLKDEFHNLHNRGENAKTPYAFENTSIDLMKWHPQIKPFESQTDTNGRILWDVIENAFNNRELFQINSIDLKNGEEWEYVRYRRHNDIGRLRENVFKKPSIEKPTWAGFSDYIQFEPMAKNDIRFSLFLYPIEANIDFLDDTKNINTDLTTSAIMSVLFRMAQLNGIKIREQQFYELTAQQENKQ